jgi:CubicO group peptidase (beta-lactamase class C family)
MGSQVMRKLTLALLLVACNPPRMEERIEQGLVESLSAPGWAGSPLEERMAHYRVPGISYAVIDDFEIALIRAHGVRRAGLEDPVMETTLFQSASIGKPVVAAAALRLVQQGKLALDEDVNRKLRSWRLPANEFGAHVTLRNLLSHSGGTTISGFPGYERGRPLPTLLQILDGKPPANSAPVRVDQVPGQSYRYSGGGYLIVQQLLLDNTDRPLAELLCKPSGMTDSYLYPLPEQLWNRVAHGHRADGGEIRGGWHRYPEIGATPLWTTPTDMARFGIELMRSYQGISNRLLSSAMAREMLTPQPGGFGLGFILVDDGGDRFHAMHAGANEGYRTLLVLYPERGEGAVIMTNGDRGDQLALELMRSLAREMGWVTGLVVELWMLAVLAALVLAAVVLLRRRRRSGPPLWDTRDRGNLGTRA